MSSKIVGVTVGTPIRPDKLIDKANAVKSVNGVGPNENGDVQIDLSESFDKTAIVNDVLAALPTWTGGSY